MSIPQDLAGRWAVLLFYRGHWCPYCRQQLLDFQRVKAQLNELRQVYQERGEVPGRADQYGPDERRWKEVNDRVLHGQ